MFNKKLIFALIIQGHNNHMTYTTSNNGGHIKNWEAKTVEKKDFQIPHISLYVHIGEIYTICSKNV